MKPLFLLLCFCCTAFSQESPSWQQQRRELIQQTTEVALPGSVGSLCVFGPKAFPLATASFEGTTRLPIIACAVAGAGRVVACSHGGYVEKDHGSDQTAELMLRLAGWASRKTDRPVRFGFRHRHGINQTLQRDGYKAVSLDGQDWLQELPQIDLLVLTGNEVASDDVQSIQRFIADGGGAIVADAAWVWDGYRRQPGELLSRDHGPNRLLGPIGIVWTRGMVKRDAGQGASVQTDLPQEIHALGAVVSIEKDQLRTKEQIEQARVALEQGFEAIPQNDRLIYPRIDRISRQIGVTALKAGLSDRRGLSDLKQRIAVGRDAIASLSMEPDQLKASPLASHFPGPAGRSGRRVERKRTIDTSRPRWHSTALYAAAGEVVTVRVDSRVVGHGLRARIGCHKDKLWHKPSWQRSPEITRTFPIQSTSTPIGNAYGGLVYIEVPNDCELGEVDVTIGGAIDAPVYIHGKTPLGRWRSIRNLPGPWAEIGSDKFILSVPSAKVRQLDRPDLLMEYWDQVLDACADLAMMDHDRASPERFVVDIQISAGYMHAGYPIMAPSNLADEVLDLETLKQKGNWGVFHGIGHNHQAPEWTYSGMGEVTVNLFSMYVYDTLHPGAHQHGQIESEKIAKMIAEFRRTGKREGPWTNLVPYIQLKQQFGWQSYRNVFQRYRQLPASERPKNDQQKRDQWMVRFSTEVGRDLSPFFDDWRIETSEAAKKQIQHLPDWSAG